MKLSLRQGWHSDLEVLGTLEGMKYVIRRPKDDLYRHYNIFYFFYYFGVWRESQTEMIWMMSFVIPFGLDMFLRPYTLSGRYIPSVM